MSRLYWVFIILFLMIIFSVGSNEGLLSTIKEIERSHKHDESNLKVDLKNPIFDNGSLSTEEGGVIYNKDLRIQAKSLRYTKKKEKTYEMHKLHAQGALVIQYKDRIFVGEKIDYDFTTSTGTIYDGKTYASPWYFGGERIDLYPDGSFSVKNAYLTTCDSINHSWDIFSKQINVTKNDLFEAKSISFRLYKTPVFYIPYWRMNLKKFASHSPIISYQVDWDKSAGPRVGLRYQAYSWKDLALFLRGDWRMSRGLGGAIEAHYLPQNIDMKVYSQNYLATDVLPNDPEKKQRYRVQGGIDWTSDNKKTSLKGTWDKFSDRNMPSDFGSKDFEVDTQKVTQLFLRHQENEVVALLHAKPRVNSFDAVEQDLPTLFIQMRPFPIPYLGIINANNSKLSYLDYRFAKNAPAVLRTTKMLRLETNHEIYRPFDLGFITITPYIGVVGIYYGNTPSGISADGLGLIRYGGSINSAIYKNYTSYKHLILPTISYNGYSTPTISVNNHFILSDQDGYNRINECSFGIDNQWFLRDKPVGFASYDFNVYAKAFLGESKIKNTVPYLFCDFTTRLNSWSLALYNSWNFWNHTLNYSVAQFGWTINENIAFTLEFRYRSRYYWRKADHFNYFLEQTRPQQDLLLSPLSDKRNTLLTNIFVRLTPTWTCHFQSHHGWNRSTQPSYNEFKFDLTKWLSSSWKLYLSYEHTRTDDKVSLVLSLFSKTKEISVALPKTSIPSILPSSK